MVVTIFGSFPVKSRREIYIEYFPEITQNPSPHHTALRVRDFTHHRQMFSSFQRTGLEASIQKTGTTPKTTPITYPVFGIGMCVARYQARLRCALEPVTLLSVKVCDYLACPNCGDPLTRQAGKCCDGACRVALHRWRKSQMREAQVARRPVVRFGGRSLKPLRSYNTEYSGLTLRTVNRAAVDSFP
jgi:hypothetical protein